MQSLVKILSDAACRPVRYPSLERARSSHMCRHRQTEWRPAATAFRRDRATRMSIFDCDNGNGQDVEELAKLHAIF